MDPRRSGTQSANGLLIGARESVEGGMEKLSGLVCREEMPDSVVRFSCHLFFTRHQTLDIWYHTGVVGYMESFLKIAVSMVASWREVTRPEGFV